ncbi:MAG TPA: RsiV family protein [Pyrinomonadaceae bacterium]
MRMKASPGIAFTILVALLLISLAACERTANTSQTAGPQTSPSPVAEQLNGAGGTTPSEVKYFKGSIGITLDLKMKLVRTSDQLTGNYFYQKVGTKIDLKGAIDQDGNVLIQEFDPTGKQTGLFKGLWSSNNETGLISIAGNWSKPPGEKGDDKKTAFSVHEEPIFFTGNVEIVSKQIKESNKKLMYEVAAYYPQITGSSNPNAEKLNQVLSALVTRKVAEFRKEMSPKKDEEPRPENSMGSDINIAYTVNLAQDDLTSIEFDIGSYYQGAAHPNSYSEVVNYDLKNGKQLKLADLFKPGAKYLQTISQYCIDDLKKQSKAKGGLLEDSSINSGASPTTKNYQSWTITKKGLGINFDSYQVGPYAAGPQFVLVPYSAIKELVNPDGPIGQFAK